MDKRDEELARMATAMFDMLKTISTRIAEMEEVEYLDWGRFFH